MRYLNILMVCTILFASSSVAFAQNDTIDADTFLQGQPPKTPAIEETTTKADDKEEPVKKLSEIEQSLELAKSELEDKEILKKKMDLARAMHQIRPTRNQVDSAVMKASYSLPANKRKAFVDSMAMMLNYNAIERISIDAMIETYTLLELNSMVEYYSKPEALSASRKIGAWASMVQPEIISMIDKALMRIKTGQ